MENKNVLVTGGTGFIGSHVVERLNDIGATVLTIDNCFAGSESLVPDGVQLDQIDIRDSDLKEVVTEFDPDAIVHLAAIHYIPYCNANPEETFQVNVMGTRNLPSAAREVSGLEKIILASSAAVYPPLHGRTPLWPVL